MLAAAVVMGLPHSGQNIAGSRTAAPHEGQRGEISGCIINFELQNAVYNTRILGEQKRLLISQPEIRILKFLNSMHCIEQIFTLCVDVHAKFLTFGSQPILQSGD